MRAWSAGCSYGAEAYTLAAVCRESIPDARVRDPWAPTSTAGWSPARGRALQRRRRARRARGRARALVRAADGGWPAKPTAAHGRASRSGDLLRMPVRPASYDLVMCRNTVIYFTEEVRDALHARLVDALAPGGYLVVGTSERVADRPRARPHLPLPLHLPQGLTMDISEYLPMFLAEGREHLQELNLAVVRIEEQPDDPETVDEIFRIAHSMKGMSATMGFAGMAALTHEMEDVFELLRQRKGGLEREAVDVLLALPRRARRAPSTRSRRTARSASSPSR